MPREAPVTRAIREARGRGIESNSLRRRPCESRDPYAVTVMMAEGICREWRPKNEGRWAWVPALAGTTRSACFRQQRQLPRLRLGLGQVGERGGIVAGKAMVGEFRTRRIAAGLAHGAVHAVDRQERQRIRADDIAHFLEIVGCRQ